MHSEELLCVTTFLLALLAGCSNSDSPSTTLGTSSSKIEQVGALPTKARTEEAFLRVCFLGTRALEQDTNAAYLTNFSSLPETVKLGQHLVNRLAILPESFLQGTKVHAKSQTSPSNGTNIPTNSAPGQIDERATEITPSSPGLQGTFASLFAEMLTTGFDLEILGISNHVTAITLSASASPETINRWGNSLKEFASRRLGPIAEAGTNSWSTGAGTLIVASSGEKFVMKLRHAGEEENHVVDLSAAFARTNEAGGADAVLTVEMASPLLPGPIQRGVYGGFSNLKLAVTPAEQSLRIRGTAEYPHDLPPLAPMYAVPTNLITEPLLSFSMVRNPAAWLEPKSTILMFLPDPLPKNLFFWGQSLPYQFFAAAELDEKKQTQASLPAPLVEQLQKLSQQLDMGKVTVETNHPSVQWTGVPFATPCFTVTNDVNRTYLTAELFPSSGWSNGLPDLLAERASGRTNLLLYDWEATGPRMDAWLHVGQLALMLSGHEQLGNESPSMKWILAIEKALAGRNTVTEITQTGPRELSFARRAPLAFTSTELFWLANWLESSNFPAADFLMPAKTGP